MPTGHNRPQHVTHCQIDDCERSGKLITVTVDDVSYWLCQTHYKRFKSLGVLGGPIRSVAKRRSTSTTAHSAVTERDHSSGRGRVTSPDKGNRLGGPSEAELTPGIEKSAYQSQPGANSGSQSVLLPDLITHGELSETEVERRYGPLIDDFIAAIAQDANYLTDIISEARRKSNTKQGQTALQKVRAAHGRG